MLSTIMVLWYVLFVAAQQALQMYSPVAYTFVLGATVCHLVVMVKHTEYHRWIDFIIWLILIDITLTLTYGLLTYANTAPFMQRWYQHVGGVIYLLCNVTIIYNVTRNPVLQRSSRYDNAVLSSSGLTGLEE